MRLRHITFSSVASPALPYFFPHYVINGTTSGQKLLDTKRVFSLPLHLLSEKFLILCISQRDITNVHISVFICSSRCSCPILIKTECSGQIFEKFPNVKFHKNPPSGSRVVPLGRTDRQITTLTVAFRNFANGPINIRTDKTICTH